MAALDRVRAVLAPDCPVTPVRIDRQPTLHPLGGEDMAKMVGLEWSPESTPAQRWCVGVLAVMALGLVAACGGWPVTAALMVLVAHRALIGAVLAVARRDTAP